MAQRLNLRAINWNGFTIQDLERPSLSIPFGLNPPQRYALSKLIELQDKRRPLWTISLKARRVGFSTFFAIMNTIHCIALPNAVALTIAHRAKNAKAVFGPARSAHRDVMRSMGLKYTNYQTQHELKFPHDAGESMLTLATAKTVEGVRGMTLTALMLSEAAFYEQAEAAFTAMISAVTYQPETMLPIESTANGIAGPGETFYKHWMDAVEGKSDFTPIFVPWQMDPRNQMDPDRTNVKVGNLNKEERELVKYHKISYPQLSWRRWAIINKTQGYVEKFHVEYPTTAEEAFTTTGDPAFNQDEMNLAQETARVKPRFYGDIQEELEA